jgi:hypothetical protein
MTLVLDFLIPTNEVVSSHWIAPELAETKYPPPNSADNNETMVSPVRLNRVKEVRCFQFIHPYYYTSYQVSKRLVDNYARVNLRILRS